MDYKDLINSEAIAKRVNEELEKEIAQSIVWKVRDYAEKQVLEIMKPDIDATISAQKEAIQKAINLAIPQIAETFAASMIANATKNLQGWNGGKLLTDLFKN